MALSLLRGSKQPSHSMGCGGVSAASQSRSLGHKQTFKSPVDYNYFSLSSLSSSRVFPSLDPISHSGFIIVPHCLWSTLFLRHWSLRRFVSDTSWKTTTVQFGFCSYREEHAAAQQEILSLIFSHEKPVRSFIQLIHGQGVKCKKLGFRYDRHYAYYMY